MNVELRVVLAMAGLFVVGGVWWCDDCGAGGFGLPRRLCDGTRKCQ